jgi:hypothetical protein
MDGAGWAVAASYQGAVRGVTKMLDRCRYSVTARPHDSTAAVVRTRPPPPGMQMGPGGLGAEAGAASMTSTREILTRVVCEGCPHPVLIPLRVRFLARVVVPQQASKNGS